MTIRIFISSPGDVQLERQFARRVIARLQAEFGDGAGIEPYFWEYEPMRLTMDYQGQIPRTSAFDIVVCILWSRLGTALASKYRRSDGTAYKSGTEFEFEDAVDSCKRTGAPDLLVYLNKNNPPIKARPKAERERQLAQFDALEAFLEHWTQEGEVVKGALTRYADVAQFEELLAEHLRKLIRARLPHEAAEAAPKLRATWTSGSPFRGLQPFEFDHAPVFRGRTRAVQDVIGEVRRQYIARQSWAAGPSEGLAPPLFVLVTAMSGIGKSSLIRAGVLPLMIAPGVVEGIGLWRRAVMKPVSAGGPFDALVEALTAPDALPELLADGTQKADLAQSLQGNTGAIDLLVKGGLSQASAELRVREEAELRHWEAEFTAAGRSLDAARALALREGLKQRESFLVLLVDQLEEIFTAGARTAKDECEAFMAALSALARSGRAVVLATLRSDFFAHTNELPILAGLIKEGALYQLEPPTSAELGQIIRDPAREAGLTFEEVPGAGGRLDDVLLHATQHNPAALPLLEFALDRLYERREPNGLLTHKAYEEMNRVEGAIAQSAEAEFATLSPAAQKSFGRLFNALVDLGEIQREERPVRRRATLSELTKEPSIAELIEKFAGARLLVLDRDAAEGGTVSVAHEALFSYWTRLKDWIEENRDLLRARRRVETAATRWEEEGRPRDLLLPDGRLLAEAVDLLRHKDAIVLRGAVEAYVRRSQATQKTRFYRRIAAVIALSVGLTGAGFISWYQWEASQRAKAEGKLFEFRQAVRDAESKFLSHGPADKSVREALDASQKVLRVIEEIRHQRGHPPEGWNDAAAKAHEFSAVLFSELGDTEGATLEIDASKRISVEKGGLSEVLFRNPAMMSYALVVFDLKLELLIANEHLKALLAQNVVLKQALNDRLKQNGQTPLPPTPPPSGTPPQPAQPMLTAQEELQQSVKAHRNLLLVLQYLTEKFGREKDFEGLALIQQRLADLHHSDKNSHEAIRLYTDRLDTARRQLEWVRDEKRAVGDPRAKLEVNALKARVRYAIELGVFYYDKLKDYQHALEAARQALQFRDAEAKLADDDDLRFWARRLMINCLVGLDRQDEALAEAKTATGDMLASSRNGLGSAMARTAQTYSNMANYYNDIGLRGRALATSDDLATAVDYESRSPLQPVGSDLLAQANLGLSWFQILNRKFAAAQATAEKTLALSLDEPTQGRLNVKRAHALLLQGEVEQARAIYEAWKLKPDAKNSSSILAIIVLDDFRVLEKLGLLEGIEAAGQIRESMRAPR